MRKIAYILLFSLLFLRSNAQESDKLFQLSSFSFNSISVDSALNLIESKTNLHFTFNSNLIPVKRNVHAEFVEVPLCLILDSLLSNPTLNYQIIDNQLVIFEQDINSSPKMINSMPTESKALLFGGLIRDFETQEALPYAAISLQSSTLGTISNEDGIFSLNLNTTYANDTILVSYLGHKTLKLPLKNLKKYQEIYLQPQSIPLQEVIIRSLQPENLVRLAIEYKFKNYPSSAFVQRAFYRESIKRDKRIMIYSEGILEVLKRPYRPTLFQEQVKLVKQRSFKSIEQQDTVQFKLHGGIQAGLDLDVVKHEFPFVDLSLMHEYVYNLRDIVLNEEKLSYKIEFKPKNDKTPFSYEGCIYLDIETLAFVKLEFKYTKKSLEKMKNAFVVRRSPKLKIVPYDASYTVTYKEFDGLFYIHHITGSLSLKVKRKNKFLASKYIASFELVSTDLNRNAPNRFMSKEIIKSTSIFSDLTTKYDLNFWGDENYLLPEVDLMKAFENLRLVN